MRPTSRAEIEALPSDGLPDYYRLTEKIVVSFHDWDYGDSFGFNYYDSGQLRCGRCDSRYCEQTCEAGRPGYVYVVGKGWLPVEAGWEAVESEAARGMKTRIEFYPTSFEKETP
jgi:hypothetical protein